MDEDGVLDFFRKRVKFLDGVVISGGEPTIVSDLIKFLESLRLLGYNIKLDTNGSKPSVIEELLKRNLVDYVALDLKSDPYNYPETLGPKEDTKEIPNTIELLKTYACAHEFRTTVVTPFITDETLLAIAKAAAGNAPLYLQYVRLSRVFDPTFMSKFPNQPKKLELMKLRKMASKYLPTFIR
jgi:pyruvate formate lyase activating enzyme